MLLFKHIIEINNKTYSYEEIDWLTNSNDEPWDEIKILWNKKSTENNGLIIYTDGSKLNNRTGFAYIILNNSNIEAEIMHRINDNSTVFTSELQAIYEGIKHIEYSNYNKGIIRTDSMSALISLNSFKRYKTIEEIRYTLRNSNKEIKLEWVKAHIGEKYNEHVDKLAKEATQKQIIDYQCRISKKFLKKELITESLKLWQNRWTNSDKGRATYNIFPTVSIKRINDDFLINQIITEHGAFPSYIHRFFNKSEICWCETSIGNVKHIIYDCPLMEDIRRNYFPKNFKRVKIINLINSTKSQQGLSEIIKRCLNQYNVAS